MSINYTFSGRRRKTLTNRKKPYKPAFKQLSASTAFVRQTPEYPSADQTACIALKVEEEEKLQISSKYTIAPAYNKGAYQVIPKENIKDIGR